MGLIVLERETDVAQMLPELREDLFGKNENRKFYNVSLRPTPLTQKLGS